MNTRIRRTRSGACHLRFQFLVHISDNMHGQNKTQNKQKRGLTSNVSNGLYKNAFQEKNVLSAIYFSGRIAIINSQRRR